ncbi:MAG: hypothetical protein JSV16_03105 [Candidatus Hydrogenedentota bacterium]|nr:MAG: hypothetical protein JSV16_03105 [Candidatus Hydrogenedentota bacterium]
MFRESFSSTMSRFFAILVLASFIILVGCATYRVTDPTSGKAYYTKKIKREKRGGTVTFTDDRTGAKVTLQSSEIQKIPRKEYKEGVKKD